MKLRCFSIQGTLGDTYITVCKLYQLYQLSQSNNEKIKVYHYTEQEYWHQEIKDIYSLLPNIEVELVTELKDEVPVLIPMPKLDQMEFFPKFDKIDSELDCSKYNNYLLIQVNSGKPKNAALSKNGTKNTKILNNEIIQKIINENKNSFTCVLIGTEECQEFDNCINLINKTSIKDVIHLTQNCSSFIGPEGLLVFVALSNKKHTMIPMTPTHLEAIYHRIIDTPWEDYCKLIRSNF